MYKRFLLLIGAAILSVSTIAFSAPVDEGAPKGTIKGFVYDSLAKQPLEYATISLTSTTTGKVVTGTITDNSGFFRIKGLEFGIYNVEITFIGYNAKNLGQVKVTGKEREIDLGQIHLTPNINEMDEVVVVADRPTMTYKIDKKVINVSQQHTSASGTAVELLESIPSITVSIDGDVSLRGSTSFSVLIDGKPSVLSASDVLAQIPASQIENIEIITNPSAKFDPDGVAGIINIIMKKNRLQGVSGIANINVGTQNQYGADVLLTYRKEKFNYFLGVDYNNRGRFGESTTKNETTKDDTTRYIYSNGDFERSGARWSVRGGIDYSITPRDVISVGANLGSRSFGGDNTQLYQQWTNPATISQKYTSYEESERGGDYITTNLDYTHNFAKKGHTLASQFIFERSNSNDEALSNLWDELGNISSGQKTIEKGPETEYRFKLDYTRPLFEKSKIEAGYQARLETEEAENNMSQYNTTTGAYDFQPLFSHDIEYNTNIHSLYSTYSGEAGKLGYQAGLRGEYTYRFIELLGEDKEFELNRWDFYPTLHLSYALPAEQQLMTSYTRRVSRTRGFYLEPFLTWEDAYNVRQGNPNLKPEYIDSYELSYQKKFKNGNVFSADLYYRITNNKIERIRSVYEPNVFLNSVDNVGKDYSFGTELMFGIDPTRWWHIDLMGNLYDYRQEGVILGKKFDKNSFNWNARFNNTFKLGRWTRVQLNGMYNSPTVTAQGSAEGFMMTSLAVKQDFLKGKLSLTVQMRDLLRTAGHEWESEGPGFYTYRKFRPDWPYISATISIKLNNYRPDRKRSQQNGGMDDMDMGGEF